MQTETIRLARHDSKEEAFMFLEKVQSSEGLLYTCETPLIFYYSNPLKGSDSGGESHEETEKMGTGKSGGTSTSTPHGARQQCN